MSVCLSCCFLALLIVCMMSESAHGKLLSMNENGFCTLAAVSSYCSSDRNENGTNGEITISFTVCGVWKCPP